MHARLLFVIGALGPGGSERQLLYLVAALRKAGIEATVAVWNFDERERYVEPIRGAGATLVPIDGHSRLSKFLMLRGLIRAGGYDLVQTFTFYLNAIVAAAAVGSGLHVIGCVRSTLALATGDSGPLLGRLSSRWPRRQIYNNGFAASEARRRRFWCPRFIEVVSNHLDVDAFPDVPLPRDGTIAAVGSLLPVKRWDRLLDLAERLRESAIDFRIRIAGDGPLRPWLESEISLRGLGEQVTLHGFVSDVKSLLSDSALLLHVSDSEGSPNVVMEAQAAGRPVVATDVGDVARLVSDGETGYVVPLGRDDLLFDRVARLLTQPDLCAEMGRRARRTTRQRFGTDALAADTLRAYRNLGWGGATRPWKDRR